jgi:hypothetical protein
LLLAAICASIILLITKTPGGYAVVVINGVETEKYSLDKDITITLQNGDGFNTLVIKDGSASICEASCPDKLCVKQHSAKYNGETLVCLPNKTTIKIVSSVESDTDFIS